MKIVSALKNHMSIYAAGNLLVKGISFLAIPIYAKIFSPNDFGVIEMVVVCGLFMATILNSGIDSAQAILFSTIKGGSHKRCSLILSSLLQFQIAWGMVVLCIALFFSHYLSEYFFADQYPWYYFAINFAGVFFSQIMLQAMDAMRLLHKSWLYFLALLVQSIISIGLLLIFVVVFKMGIVGVLFSSAISSLMLAIFSWALLHDFLVMRKPIKTRVILIAKICLPFLPVGIVTYFLMNGNRWILEYYFGEEAVGLFVIAAKFSLLVTIFLESFRMAWWPLALRAMKLPDGKDYFYSLSGLYVGVGCAAIVFISFLSPYLLKYFTAPAYYSSWPMVGIFCWQLFFYIFGSIFTPGIWVASKTYLNLPIALTSVMAGGLLSCILIPTFGAIGASVSNVLIFMIFCVISVFTSEFYWKINYPICKFVLQILIAMAQMVIIINFNDILSFMTLFSITLVVILGLIYSSINLNIIKKLKLMNRF